MIKDLFSLKTKYKMNLLGIIHVGAYDGSEISIYRSLGIDNIIFFEPLSKNYSKLIKTVDNKCICIQSALGNFDGEIQMYVSTNKAQSSSILEPLYHLTQYPNILFNTKEIVQIKKLDNIYYNTDRYNLLIIDAQGYELEILKGCSKNLNHIDYIITEVNREFLYKDCALIQDIDNFLQDFKRVETKWCGRTWGNALYIKRVKVPS